MLHPCNATVPLYAGDATGVTAISPSTPHNTECENLLTQWYVIPVVITVLSAPLVLLQDTPVITLHEAQLSDHWYTPVLIIVEDDSVAVTLCHDVRVGAHASNTSVFGLPTYFFTAGLLGSDSMPPITML